MEFGAREEVKAKYVFLYLVTSSGAAPLESFSPHTYANSCQKWLDLSTLVMFFLCDLSEEALRPDLNPF